MVRNVEWSSFAFVGLVHLNLSLRVVWWVFIEYDDGEEWFQGGNNKRKPENWEKILIVLSVKVRDMPFTTLRENVLSGHDVTETRVMSDWTQPYQGWHHNKNEILLKRGNNNQLWILNHPLDYISQAVLCSQQLTSTLMIWNKFFHFVRSEIFT